MDLIMVNGKLVELLNNVQNSTGFVFKKLYLGWGDDLEITIKKLISNFSLLLV